MKKFIALLLTVVLTATIAVGGTVAYLESTDEVKNTMTVGSVKIDVLEYQRVVDEDGEWQTSTHQGYGYTADLMEEYEQDKVMIPAVGIPKWDDRNGSEAASGDGSHQQPWSQIGAPGSNQLFDDSFANVHDKFVFVKNTGSVDAYYRTWIAIEAPDGTEVDGEYGIATSVNVNNRFVWDKNLGEITVDGVNYYVMVATHTEALKPNDISRPSLLQLYMMQEITSEQAAKFGEKVDVLVFTQAVQADGWKATDGKSAAEVALDTTFGTLSIANHPWAE